jgi:hypothetical protein
MHRGSMDESKFTLVGRLLSDEELADIPLERRFKVSETESLTLPNITAASEISLQSQQVEILCPSGPHPDGGLARAISNACGISGVDSVTVQCSQGHWAAYLCILGARK